MISIDADTFWSRVRKDPNGCWLWTLSRSTHGYGQQWHAGKIWRCHRLAWVLTHGPIPKGQCVCHRCDNPLCVRVDHLFLGTQRENLRDMVRKGRYRGVPSDWRGTKNIRAKLTEADVRAIRIEYANGSSLRVLSRKYGIAHTAIASVLKRRTWAHIV